jgi:SAM-dependent MidA family methyltransferase
MDPQIELRREAGPDLNDIGQDEALVERIRAEIQRDGPMSFARFMALALYDPDGGYYRGPNPRPGRAGDFLTAPELHPIFGATLSTGIQEIWERLGQPRPFVVREYGAGDGAMAVSILDPLREAGSPLLEAIRYQPIEVDERRTKAFRERLASAGHGARFELASDRPIDGIVLANEVLDALPVHRVRGRVAGLSELAVDLDADAAFVEVEVEPSSPALAARLAADGVELIEGQTAEICLELERWIATAASGLGRGLLLLIDYGAPAVDLYDPQKRFDGTLRAYVRQQVHADPYRHVGRQDLTAHVDVTAVERAAREAGLGTIGVTTQAEALIGLGIEARLQSIQADPATTMEGYALLRASLLRLLDPAAMGRFGVMAFGRGWPEEGPPLGLFAFRLPNRAGADRREGPQTGAEHAQPPSTGPD